MDTHDQNAGDCAIPDDIRNAIERLTEEESYRLRMAATYCLFGTEYQSPDELINEAVQRTLSAAVGEKGRVWKTTVPFIAYMIQTVRGLANDSLESSQQTKTDYIECMATESMSSEDSLFQKDHFHDGPESIALESDEINERQAIAKADVDAIERLFANDDDIGWIIMGLKDDYTATQIKEVSGMSDTQYETARRRFRRGLEKLPLKRSKS